MKRLLLILASIVLAVGLCLGIGGCKKDSDDYDVYVPDGAPALAVCGLENTELDDIFDVDAVKADTISAYVTGKNPKADFAILPVNAAVKLLGSGTQYKMLGTVTHGNLFILKKSGQSDIATKSDLSNLTGKTVGVINLVNVPGLTFKVILNDNGLQYNELKDGTSIASDKVNLKNIQATEVNGNSDCDYFIVPEPAASTKVAALSQVLSFAGSLQALYGEGNGYPQAVAVAKCSVIEKSPSVVQKFTNSFSGTVSWLMDEGTSAVTIANRVCDMLDDGMTPTFNANNLLKTVISNCGIKFVKSADCKAEILEFMSKFNAVSGNAWGTPADQFFCV